jgi:hypothetical protein
MAGTLLNFPKGIDTITTAQIPNEWDSDWFSKFINLWLAQADVRNASGLNGIAVAGQSTRPGTISFTSSTSYTWTGTSTFNGSSIFNGPFTVQAVNGQPATINLIQTGVASWVINNPGASTDLQLVANGVLRLTLTYNGNLVIPTPVSGRCLTIGDTTMMRTTVSFTNGAAAAAGTLLNAPTAGNPTKWIPIDDNGTTRYIPAW